MSVLGPGCVKTRLSLKRTELFSQFSSSGRCNQCNSLSEWQDRKEASTTKSVFRVFTQPGSKQASAGVLAISGTPKSDIGQRRFAPEAAAGIPSPFSVANTGISTPKAAYAH
jgi:hypothetical protein